MNKLLKKRMLIISISLAFLLLINICVSYSYYLGKVVGNESDTTIGIKSSGIIITYENNSDVIDASNVVPGWSATKNFSISSTVAENQLNETTSNLWYEIYLYVDKNDFPDNILTYSFSSAGNNVGNGQVAESRTNIGLPLSTELNVITIGTGNVAVGENVHNYSITFDYSIEKSNHPDCIFNARIGAKAVVNSVIYLNIDGGEIEGEIIKYVSKGGTITLQTPVKENAVFGGWTVTKGDGFVSGNELTVNDAIVEVQAIWNTHAIANSILTIDLDGGTWSGDTLIQTETNTIIKLERPTKPYYIFEGWEVVEGNAEISGDNIVAYDSKVVIKAIFIDMVPVFTYKKSDGTDASYIILRDDATSWRIKFLESGTLNFQSLGNIVDNQIDAFLVGGGGGGGTGHAFYTDNENSYFGGGGGGGGGGYTTTSTISVSYSVDYPIVVGAGGASQTNGSSTTAFELSALGGNKGVNGAWRTYGYGGEGGNNGGKGANGLDTSSSAGGSGILATREFGETEGSFYSGGGGGGGYVSWAKCYGNAAGGEGGGGAGGLCGVGIDGTANSGGGGGGGGGNPAVYPEYTTSGAAGGSGIVIIRNHKE